MLLVAISASNLAAAPINFSQQPAGNGGQEPAPNIVLSVDDSGSMGWDVNGCQTKDWNVAVYGNQHEPGATGCGPVGTISTNPSRISTLRTALRAQFGDGTATNKGLVSDDRIRLAWQAMHNNGLAPTAGSLVTGNTNSMKRFSGAHRKNFEDFIASLTPNNGTPSHKMMSQAYSFMKSPKSNDSPWAFNPGKKETPYLSCRRSYHVFMTDGAWNSAETVTSLQAQCTNLAGTIVPNANCTPANVAAGFKSTFVGRNGVASAYSIGNIDGSDFTLPNGLAYNGTSTTNAAYRAYRDSFGGAPGSGTASTLADYSFRSWAEDLQTDIPNSITPLIRQSGNETVTSVGSTGGISATLLPEFWNPKNNPATWQHLTQHTIGFGKSAVSWPGAPEWNPTNNPNTSDNTYGGGYNSLITGDATWQNPIPWTFPQNRPTSPDINAARPSELWHAALNGRGKFYPARNDDALKSAFADILNNILNDTSDPLTSIAANGTTLKGGLNAYIAGYNAKNWSGRLLAYPINATSAVIGNTPVWSASAKLDEAGFIPANRFVASYNGAEGIEWKTYDAALKALQPALNKNSAGNVDDNGQLRLDYLRGDRSKEASKPGGIFRTRDSILGDIVNSNILYVANPNDGYKDAEYLAFKETARPAMVYVGANDGMLHGFDAATGVEKLAYVPQGIAQGDIRKLTDINYAHQYFVDGTPFSSDAKVGKTGVTPTWTSVLVTGLGAGGKGYVALDASNAANFTAAKAANLVIADTTATTDADIGNMFITPALDDFITGKSDQIVRLNAPKSGTAPNEIKHRWALVLGNGYNSANEAPVLVVQYLDGAREIKKISPCAEPIATTACSYKTGNGLSTPRLVDLSGDGVADVAYAGDLKGNVWKFDLSSTNNAEWKTSFSGAPFFIAKPGQSFTTAPYVAPNAAAGFGVMVNINSGRNLTTADQTTKATETVYTLWDNSKFNKEAIKPATVPPSFKFVITDSSPINTTAAIPTTLVKQTISSTTFFDKGFRFFTSSSNPVNYSGVTPNLGWYMDWEGVPGQRVLQNSKAFDGQKIQINSTKPSSIVESDDDETCTPSVDGERSFLTVLNLFTGNPAKDLVFDLTTTVGNTNPNTTTIEGNPAGDNIILNTPEGGKPIAPCPEGTVCKEPPLLKYGKYVGARANWREKK
jgi:type IV pilus assembly protein PilY1